MSIQALRERLAHVKKLNLNPQYFGGAGVTRAELEAALLEHDKLRIALEEIRDGRKPQVCAEYTLCTHEGCAASYAAFVIADIALKPKGNGEGGKAK